MSIRQLSPSIVNKIAAGEVIERPASVVKELLENAVDAGATRIDVSVAQGGIELVRVVDNGHGISADELPLAVAPHATSKIVEADDLFRIGTLGFRGEALASIAEISRLIVRSRPSEADAGAEIVVNGGQARAGRAVRLRHRHGHRSSQLVFQYAGAAEVFAHRPNRAGAHQRSVHTRGLGIPEHSLHTTASRQIGVRPASCGKLAGTDRGIFRRRPGRGPHRRGQQ